MLCILNINKVVVKTVVWEAKGKWQILKYWIGSHLSHKRKITELYHLQLLLLPPPLQQVIFSEHSSSVMATAAFHMHFSSPIMTTL